mmetsp:Transcript_50551/g.133469  ORF Transcript_50551/g.133469 Transcript_50551/m.133469 type:complete len:212 (+) Transcript_50551:215-850(+)
MPLVVVTSATSRTCSTSSMCTSVCSISMPHSISRFLPQPFSCRWASFLIRSISSCTCTISSSAFSSSCSAVLSFVLPTTLFFLAASSSSLIWSIFSSSARSFATICSSSTSYSISSIFVTFVSGMLVTSALLGGSALDFLGGSGSCLSTSSASPMGVLGRRAALDACAAWDAGAAAAARPGARAHSRKEALIAPAPWSTTIFSVGGGGGGA